MNNKTIVVITYNYLKILKLYVGNKLITMSMRTGAANAAFAAPDNLFWI